MLKQLDFVSDLNNSKNEEKMRWWILLIFLGTLIPGVIFWLISTWRQNPPKIKFPLKEINISRVSSSKSEIYKLTPKIDKWAEENISSLPGKWSVKINFLENDFSWQRYSTRKMPAASLIKLPVVAGVYKSIEDGEYQSEEELGESTFGDLASRALSHSDNQAWELLQKEIGNAKINSLMLEWGMKDTSLEDQTTTVEDISLFLTKLYLGELISDEYSEKMLNHMTNTIYEDEIPAGVPEGIRVAHKVGYLDNAVSDAGIVYFPNNPYVLVIMSDQTNPQIAKQKFPEIVNELYWIIADSI
jgi:beta-lactamase class A